MDTVLTISRQAYFAQQLLFACSITLTKLSILFFYRRIFPSRQFALIEIILGSVMIGWWLSLVFAVIFSCHPVNYFWNKSVPNGHCINENILAYGVTAVNIVTDLAVLCLPIPWLWTLQMPLSRKLGLIGIFCLGGL